MDWASIDWQAIGAGIAVVILGLLAQIGRMAARGSPPQDQQRMEIAGALIDGSDARALKAALDRNSEAMEKTAGRWDKNTEAAEALRDQAKELRDDIKVMTREIIRSQR